MANAWFAAEEVRIVGNAAEFEHHEEIIILVGTNCTKIRWTTLETALPVNARHGPLFSPMRRYLVFTYYAGRPHGGFHDFLDSFSTLPEALDNLLDEPGRYFQIVDRNTMRILRQGLTEFKNYSPDVFEREAEG